MATTTISSTRVKPTDISGEAFKGSIFSLFIIDDLQMTSPIKTSWTREMSSKMILSSIHTYGNELIEDD
jgi:hypothetical protein